VLDVELQGVKKIRIKIKKSIICEKSQDKLIV
jgi:hypothetical protein